MKRSRELDNLRFTGICENAQQIIKRQKKLSTNLCTPTTFSHEVQFEPQQQPLAGAIDYVTLQQVAQPQQTNFNINKDSITTKFAATQLQNLPTHLLACIFAFLYPQIDFEHVALTCKNFFQALQFENECWDHSTVRFPFDETGLAKVTTLKYALVPKTRLKATCLKPQYLVPILSVPQLSQVKTLDLSFSYLDTYNLVQWSHMLAPALSKLTHLESLELGNIGFGAVGCKNLSAPLSQMQQLRKLNLFNNTILAEGMQILATEALPHLKKLQHLNLCNNGIGSLGAQYLSEALKKGLFELEILELSSNHIGDSLGMQTIAEALEQGLPKLKVLTLCNNRIQSTGIEYLTQALKNKQGLRKLDLSMNFLRDKGVRLLAMNGGITSMAELAILDLSYNEVCDDGAKALAYSLPCNLQRLLLGSNQISDESIATLADKLSQLHGLIELDLHGNHISDTASQVLSHALSKLTGLQTINLRGTQITPVGAQVLVQSLPQFNTHTTQLVLFTRTPSREKLSKSIDVV